MLMFHSPICEYFICVYSILTVISHTIHLFLPGGDDSERSTSISCGAGGAPPIAGYQQHHCALSGDRNLWYVCLFVCAYSRVFCVVCASAYIRRPILSCMQLVDVMISCLIWFSFFCFWFSCTDNLYASITDKGFLCLEEKNLLPANSSVGKYFMVILLIFVVFLLHWRVPILAHNPLSTF